jgi:carboxyl-terminal processing protease
MSLLAKSAHVIVRFQFQHLLGISASCLLIGSALSVSQESKTTKDLDPRAYIEQALDLMQKNALHRDEIDWQRVRQETIARAKEARTTADTYPALAYALTQLKEEHSFFIVPDDLSPLEKERAEAAMAKIKPKPLPIKDSPFSPSTEIRGHMDRDRGRMIAHIFVPNCLGPNAADPEKNAPYFQEFAEKLHALVVSLEAQKPSGWIVDLRGNQGGNVWPMLAGIGPLLGEGDLGAFQARGGSPTPWFYKSGKAGIRSEQGEEISAEIKQPSVFKNPPPVAVLLDRATGSSGEVVAISFAGRPRTRSFGEHTAGLTTANEPQRLGDGALLILCVALEVDRNGKQYPNGLDPDSALPAPSARPAEGKDVVVQAAIDWLAGQTEVAQKP